MKHIKFMAAVLLSALLVLLITPAASCADSSDTRLVRVGYTYIKGYQMMDGAGNKSGYAYEYLQRMKLYTNWEYEYVGYDKSWEDIQQMLEDGEVDMLVALTKTPERAERFDFTESALITETAVLSVCAEDSAKYRPGDYESYNGMKVGMVRGSYQVDSMSDFAAERGFEYTPVFYPNGDALMDAFERGGEMNAMLLSNLNVLPPHTGIEMFDPQPIPVTVRKGDTELLKQAEYALEQINIFHSELDDELYEKYYSDGSGGSTFYTPEEWRFIDIANEENNSFSALIAPDMPPFCSNENGELHGALIDSAKLVIEKSGLSFSLLPVSDREQYGQALKDGEGTLWLCARNDLNYAETMGYHLTEPFCSVGISRLVLKGGRTQNDRVAVIRGSDVAAYYAAGRLPNKELIYYDSYGDCAKAVLSGKCAEAYLPTLTCQLAAAEDETRTLSSMLVPGARIEYCFGVRDGSDPRLGTILSKTVNNMSAEPISDIFDEYAREITQRSGVLGFVYDNLLSSILIIILFFTVILVCIVARSASMRRNMELRKNLLLSQALADAERANCAKSDFLSRMSHDMRTPMNAIIGFSSDSAEMDEDTAKDNLQMIYSSAQHLLTLINDTLDMSKIESGKIELHPTLVNGRELFVSVATAFEQSIKEKGIEFAVSVSETGWLPIKADVSRVKQIIMNLLSNALKFTPEGGRIEYRLEILGAERGYLRSRVVIRDTGCGMSQEFLDRIYEPFAQERNSFTESYAGSGLGMPIVKRLVELMDGSISIKSELGEGTEITLLLEFDVAYGPEEIPVRKTQFDSLAGMNVLLVEDHDINALVAGRLLSKECVCYDRASNGKEAVDMFAASPIGCYEAILMDIRMPVMDGYEATRAIRSLERADAKTVQIIAMTANAFDDDIRASFAAGMNEHLGKPIEPYKLFSALEAARNGSLGGCRE